MSNTRKFNGVTLSFAGATVGRVNKISYKANGATIDVTEPEDVYKLYELGHPDLELTIGLAGNTPPTQGAKGALAINLANGTTKTLPGTWQCMSNGYDGDDDGKWTGSATFKPTVAD